MSDRKFTDKIVYVNWQSQAVQEVFPGIKATSVWQGENNRQAVVVTIEPGGKWRGLDVHETSSEEIFVVSGVFSDGDYAPRSLRIATTKQERLFTILLVRVMFLNPRRDTFCLSFIPIENGDRGKSGIVAHKISWINIL